MSRRRLAPEGRRRELLEAGLEVIRVKGGDAKIGDVLAAAGAARGTFYVYFANWTEYLAEIRDHLGHQMARRFAELSACHDDWRSFWSALPALFVKLTLELEGLEALYTGPLAAAAGEDELTRRSISALVEQTVGAGAMVDADPSLIAPLVYAAVHETIESVLGGADAEVMTATCGKFLVAAMGVGAIPRPPLTTVKS